MAKDKQKRAAVDIRHESICNLFRPAEIDRVSGEAASDDGSLTGRGKPLLREVVCRLGLAGS
jgi:hypothetical protein